MQETSNLSNAKARPHFVLRDINTGSKNDVQVQFDKIKLALEEAARAADKELSQLIDIEESTAMMDTFHGAIDLEAVYANGVLTQTKSHQGFRDQCGMLRGRLMDFSKNLEKEKR